MGRGASSTGVLLLCALLGAACNRGPAREALAEAEQAIEAGRPQLEAYAPDELAAVRAEVQAARAQLDEGRYTDALRVAQRLPGRIRRAVEESGRRRALLDTEWSTLSGRLPRVLRGLELRLQEAQAKRAAARAAAAKPAAGAVDQDPLAEPRERLAALTSAWASASRASAGQLASAVSAAREVASGADALAVRLGFTSVQAAALASAVEAAAAAPSPAAPTAAAATPRP